MDRRRFLQSSVAASVMAALPATQARAALQALLQISGDVRAVTGDRTEISLERAAVQELADSLRGNLLLPGNEGYDVARRVLNKSIDRHPALIVQPLIRAIGQSRNRRMPEKLGIGTLPGGFIGNGFSAVLAEVEMLVNRRIGPGATGAIEPVRLIGVGQRNRRAF